MTSKLYVNSFEPMHGDTISLAGSNSKLHVPGSVVQVAYGRTGTWTEHSSTSFTASNLSATITPKFANSKLVFDVSGVYWWSVAGAISEYFVATIYDSRTGAHIMPQGGSHNSLWFQGANGNNNTYDRIVYGQTIIDNDSVVPRTYTVYVRVYYGNGTVRCFEPTADNLIRITEIAQ